MPSGATAKFQDITISKGVSVENGGGINLLSGGTLTTIRGKITACVTEGSGGAVGVEPGAKFTLIGTKVEANFAKDKGGDIL